MPRFSIITVVRNDLEGLRRTRASLVFQDFADFEHIVIDGASTDGTVEWLESQPESPTFRWISEKDRGVYDAMNKGAALVEDPSTWIVFMNAGDTYRGNRALRHQSDAAWRGGSKWGYSRAIVVDEERRPVRPAFGLKRYSIVKHAYARVALCHQAVFVTKGAFDEIGGFDGDVYREVADYAFLLLLGRRYRPVIVPEVDVNYLDGGISAVNPKTQILKHQARVGVFEMGPGRRALDYLFFVYSESTARARRTVKRAARRLAGQDAIERYASRGTE